LLTTSLFFNSSFNLDERLDLFRSALQGVNFLHSNGWLHGDLKPANIGIHKSQAILLDLGSAIRLGPGQLVPETPGCGGTKGYLAPEREMEEYGFPVDVWSMGVIGFEILHQTHPWHFVSNPWRRGHEFLQPEFHEKYQQAMLQLTTPELSMAERQCELKPSLSCLQPLLMYSSWQTTATDVEA
jgi:serine/threonine protein kinase